MDLEEEKSDLESVHGDLNNYWTSQESRLLAAVEKDPLDYDSWSALVDAVERQGTHEKECSRMQALSRALCSVEVLLKGQLEIRLFSARYQEHIGDISGARQQYLEIYSTINPGSLEVLEALANMERRLGDDEKVCLTYEDAIAAGNKQAKPQRCPALLVQYASFALMVLEDPHKSKKILTELHGLNLTLPVIKEVINLASMFSQNKDNKDIVFEFLDSLVQRYLLCDLNDGIVPTKSERMEVSGIHLEFLDMFGDISSINAAVRRHISLFREAPFLSKKRARYQ